MSVTASDNGKTVCIIAYTEYEHATLGYTIGRFFLLAYWMYRSTFRTGSKESVNQL